MAINIFSIVLGLLKGFDGGDFGFSGHDNAHDAAMHAHETAAFRSIHHM